MKSLFRRKQTPQPFLAPLAATATATGATLLAIVLMLPAPEAGVAPAAAPAPDAPLESAEAAGMPVADEEPVQVAVEESAAETAADLTHAAGEEQQPDPARTASILPAMPGAGIFLPSVPVAETEDEIAALEDEQRRDVEADLGGQAPATEEAAALPQDTTAMRPARAIRPVNMRAGPDDGTRVLMVVPGQAEIEAEDGCGWCEITYRGRTGYIYKTFISYAD